MTSHDLNSTSQDVVVLSLKIFIGVTFEKKNKMTRFHFYLKNIIFRAGTMKLSLPNEHQQMKYVNSS